MQDQLDFWTATQKTVYAQRPWESLSVEEQAEMIARLARLMARVACPRLIDNNQGDKNEQ